MKRYIKGRIISIIFFKSFIFIISIGEINDLIKLKTLKLKARFYLIC